jgi:hypothetical protein
MSHRPSSLHRDIAPNPPFLRPSMTLSRSPPAGTFS